MKFPKWMSLAWLFPEPAPDPVRLRLMEIEADRAKLQARIEQAKRQKRAWMPMWAELHELENEALRLGGK